MYLLTLWTLLAGNPQAPDPTSGLGPYFKADTVTKWKHNSEVSVLALQNHYVNWVQGGESNVSASATWKGEVSRIVHKFRYSHAWNLQLGGQHTQGITFPTRKNLDKMESTTSIGFKATPKSRVILQNEFKSQFLEGYTYKDESRRLVSGFLAPAYDQLTLGYQAKPFKDVEVIISPLSAKITYVGIQTLADQGAYGVDPAVYDTSGRRLVPGENWRIETGSYATLHAKKQLMTNVTGTTSLKLFSAYENPGVIDVEWETQIKLQINKYLSTYINTLLIYDEDQKILVDESTGKKEARIQFREVFGLGFNIKF